MFDLFKKQSFANLSEWLKEVQTHAKDNVSLIVIGNKSDKTGEEREVSEVDIQKFTEETGIRVYEASAKTGENVENSFLTLTQELIDKYLTS